MMASKDKTNNDDNNCVIPSPVPASELPRYSINRDAHRENDIAEYVRLEAPDEDLLHVEKVKEEIVVGDKYEIWDVTTDKNRWWVITNLTNLYSQKHFPSLDYTLSFHIGLMMRLRSRSDGANSDEPHPFDEVFRRQEQARNRHDTAVEAEDYQAVGMHLRECLVAVVGAMRRRVNIINDGERPHDADFVGWSTLLFNELCAGQDNKQLRQYLKTNAKETWQLVNWLTHDRNAKQTASSIAIHACDTVVGHSVQILERERSDRTKECTVCKSRNIRTHFDPSIDPDGDYYMTCGVCNWSNHPSGTA
jgi:hypothetical protein